MKPQLALAVCLTITACDAPPRSQVVGALALQWRAASIPCFADDAEKTAFVDDLADLLRDLDPDPQRALSEARDLLAQIRSPSVQLEIDLLGPRDLLATARLGCASSDTPGADLWLSVLGPHASAWRLRARKRFSAPLRHQVVALGTRTPRLAVLSVDFGTQAAVGQLRLLDHDLAVLDHLDDLLDPDATQHGPVALLHWTRAPRHLHLPWASPLLVGEDAVLDLDRDPAILRGPSSAPWLDAFDAACDGPPSGLPCDGELISDRVVGDQRELHITASPHPLRCAVTRNAPLPVVVEDRSAVVTMQPSSGAWHIVAVRPGDRLCAVHGARLIPPDARATTGDLVDIPGIPRALAATDDALLVATSDSILTVRDGAVSLLARASEPRALTATATGVAYLDDTGAIRVIPGPSRPLAIDVDAVALTACGHTLCWSAYDAGQIRRLRRGKVETLATGLHHPLGLAAAADHLIVATDDGLVTVSLATGTVAPLADAHAPVPDAHAPLHVALAGDALAWTEATGRLVLHLAGRSHPLPSGGRPSSLTLSAHHLYWLDLEAGAIRRTRLR